jgi:hypothetical protein
LSGWRPCCRQCYCRNSIRRGPFRGPGPQCETADQQVGEKDIHPWVKSLLKFTTNCVKRDALKNLKTLFHQLINVPTINYLVHFQKISDQGARIPRHRTDS